MARCIYASERRQNAELGRLSRRGRKEKMVTRLAYPSAGRSRGRARMVISRNSDGNAGRVGIRRLSLPSNVIVGNVHICDGQNEMEPRSAFAVRRRGNVTAMTLNDTLADRQA
jgi:hypothetical protein